MVNVCVDIQEEIKNDPVSVSGQYSRNEHNIRYGFGIQRNAYNTIAFNDHETIAIV